MFQRENDEQNEFEYITKIEVAQIELLEQIEQLDDVRYANLFN